MKYQIKIDGKLDSSWAEWLGGLELITKEENGSFHTLLTGFVEDQPALFSILERIRNLNLLPILIERIDKEE
jgi:hypothetical protein